IRDEAAVAALQTTTELIALARTKLSEAAWDFVVGGAETETTVLRNRRSLDGIAFRPRVLRNVEHAAPRARFAGEEYRLPVLLAPLASMRDIHPEGALPAARAAGRFGCPILLSSVAEPEWEAAARTAGEQFMFQLYADGDESWVLDTAKKAADLGCK